MIACGVDVIVGVGSTCDVPAVASLRVHVSYVSPLQSASGALYNDELSSLKLN